MDNRRPGEPVPGRRAKGLATVTIAVPARASAGEQYGVVWAEVSAPPPPGGGIGATNRVGVRMYLSVGAGGEPASDFEVSALQGQRAADGSPVVVATVRNTGARALDLGGELRLANGPGGLSAGPISASVGSTLGLGQTGPVTHHPRQDSAQRPLGRQNPHALRDDDPRDERQHHVPRTGRK